MRISDWSSDVCSSDLLMPATTVLVVILLLTLLTTIQMLPDALRIVDWKMVLRLFLPSLLGLPVGLATLHILDTVVLRTTVAVVVTVVAVKTGGGSCRERVCQSG